MATPISTISKQKQKHALHNEAVCQSLVKQTGCNDWVVTTAFYAALHFVESRLFPFEDSNGRYNNVSEFYKRNRHGYLNKHDATVRLTHMRMPEIGLAYEHLHNQSHYARYIDYDVEPAGASLAMSYLSKIKKYILSL